MRRLIAFITLALTLVAIAVIGIPTIGKTTEAGIEFDGGYDILYHVTDGDGLSYHGNALNTAMSKATKNINERLNTLHISYPEVSIEDEEYIRVTVPNAVEDELETISYALANNGMITLRNNQDELLAKGDDVFSSLSLTVSGGTVYMIAKVKDYKTLESITQTIVDNQQPVAEGEAQTPGLIIWAGFEEIYSEKIAKDTGFAGDSYANIDSNNYTRWKLLSAISLDTAITEDFSVQAAVSETTMGIYNQILSSNFVTYQLQEEYTSPVGSLLNKNAPKMAMIAGVIGIAIIAVLMIVAFRFAGLASVFSVFVYAVVVLATYNLFGGLFGTETIAAMLIGIGLAVDANIVFLERIKDEIRKGKTIKRSYEEGSKKSVSTVLDANVLVIVAAFALYLFGNQVVKSFAALMIISGVAIMVVVVLLTRLMFSLICHSEKFQGKPGLFGVKASEINDVENLEENTNKVKFDKTNFMVPFKKLSIISGGIVGVGLVIALIFQFAAGTFFNFSSQMSNGSRIYFRTLDEQFATTEGVKSFFADEDYADRNAKEITIGTTTLTLGSNDAVTYRSLLEHYNVDVDNISRNRVTVYNVTVTFSKALDDQSTAAIDEYFDVEGTYKTLYGSEYDDEKDSIEIIETLKNYSSSEYKSYSGNKTALNALLSLGMLMVFAIIYLTIRFTLSYSITAVLTIIHNLVILLAIVAITRINFSIEVIAACLAMVIFTINNLVITFDRLRENVAETKNMIWNKESRSLYINKALQQTMYGHIFTGVASVVIAIAVIAIGGVSLIPLGLILLIGVLSSAYGTYLIMPHIWVFFDGVLAITKDNAKRKRATKKAAAKGESGEAEEYVFFGIND